VAGVVLGAIFVDGYRRTPTGPAVGLGLRGSPAAIAAAPVEGQTLRVGIYNIQGGVGLDGRRDLPRIAGVIRGCDLVGLNEVHGRSMAEPRDQAHILGDELATGWLFAPTERRWWRDDFGNGMLCDRPVSSWQRMPIAGRQSRSNRNVILARVAFGGKMVHVLVTHLDRHEDHEAELLAVTELFLSLAEPAILMGDLNDTAKNPVIMRLTQTAEIVDAIARVPNVRHTDSDWIFLRGLQCRQAGMHDKGPSDHPFFWADVGLEP
jgi:endonuclease/exonuclease/phosphatase family metal-dependent hydrolase